MLRSLLHSLVASLAVLAPVAAQFPDDSFGLAEQEEATEARLVSSASSIAPGEPFDVALDLKHPEGWHSYYLNSGGIEESLTIRWELPEGFEAGEIQWPTPEVKESYFGKSFIYSDSVTFLITITPPADLQAGSEATLTAWPKWQICKDLCKDEPKPEKAFELKLPVGDSTVIDPANAALFAAAKASQPSSTDAFEVTASWVGKKVELRITPGEGSPDLSKTDFIPDQAYVLSASSEGSSIENVDGSWLFSLGTKTEKINGDKIPKPDALSGTLVGDGLPESGLKINETPFTKAPVPPLALGKFLPILGGMLIGGLILNLMPCVFPVIGLKIMGFVQQAGEDRKKIVMHGLAFTLGVLVSFWALSGLLFALRSAAAPGEEIGWGYQLQNPWTILVLMLLMFVLGLSMYGVFEVGSSATGVGGKLQSKQGVSGSFFSGILATVVATPCSAPFLGAAIGAAIALPAAQFFLAFTFMAIGLSLPYLILSIFPKLIDLLPRPGPWMESFKQAMSFLLFATAGFLLWVYTGQIGLENMLNVIIGLTLIGMAGWVFGRWDVPSKSHKVRGIAKGTTVAFAVLGLLACKPPEKSAIEWGTWSNEGVEELLENDTPVFVDFTAQWCATCQLNKKRAYSDQVATLMNDRGIVALRADKTKPNPEIDAKLEELERSAIPVNVLYIPGKEPIITPEILSSDYLEELFSSEVPVPEKDE
ncbi:protein-disulfide reductase DsbD family protein [Haloferula rosea]|uniref:Thioredoxin family protein n=1 Tax=Haloferula rosea TaxID=490093 RepID=A0A934RAE1_9BACT|nr:protein-disulfide reductase DsbD domain-containing protein [Haloferula rosea]MBK1826002.1 thioredoxin family protein [Haloferula rosea]